MTVREIMVTAIRELVAVSPEHADRIALRLASDLYDRGWHIVQCDNAIHHPKPN